MSDASVSELRVCVRELLRTLMESFPRKIELDYFELSGILPHAVGWSPKQVKVAEHIVASVDFMLSCGLIEADSYRSGTYSYAWNVRLTWRAYAALQAIRRKCPDDQEIDFQCLLSVMSRHVPTTATTTDSLRKSEKENDPTST
jgi:hypothetical protein